MSRDLKKKKQNVDKAELAFGAERCKYEFPVILTSLSLSRLKKLFKCELSEHCSVTKLALRALKGFQQILMCASQTSMRLCKALLLRY